VPEIPVGAEAGLFRRLVGRLLRVPAKTGEDVVAHDLPAFVRSASAGNAGGVSRALDTQAELRQAFAKGGDTYWLTRRALSEAGPEGKTALQTLDKNGTKIEYAEGGGSYYEHAANTVHIDLNMGNSAVQLVHESTHVQWAHGGFSADVATMGKADFINATLREEADATTRQVYTNIHLQYNNPHLNLPDTALQHQFMAGYNAAGDAGARQAVYDEFQSGRVKTSNTQAPYTEYYGAAWDAYQAWMKKYGRTS
jgi:hypothetical protein